LIGDPEKNLYALGPHPEDRRRKVFHWFEMCDAVQAEYYEIDHVQVSNFLLPLYFTDGNERGSRNDFLGHLHDGKSLASFGANPGGYIGFYDPQKKDDGEYYGHDDERAAHRLQVKQKATVRRSIRRLRAF